MEPVWFQYGSGIALTLGLPWLTHRAVGVVKVWGLMGELSKSVLRDQVSFRCDCAKVALAFTLHCL